MDYQSRKQRTRNPSKTRKNCLSDENSQQEKFAQGDEDFTEPSLEMFNKSSYARWGE